ncbi:hypothetical protein AB0M43_15205 [Longispora sp. NPDC051575]|uniref:hypothetical protein n=1 Tax=Longispora sp. NPDC051575 TaxID=3154943 RepID=UPI0034324BD5
MRARSGMITSLVFGVLLLLCVGGGTGAFALVRHLEGPGALTPAAAAESFLNGVFNARDLDMASKYVCSELEPDAVAQKINEVNALGREHPFVSFDWTKTEKSNEDHKAVLDVMVRAIDKGEAIAKQHLEIAVVDDGGWRVCGVRRLPS